MIMMNFDSFIHVQFPWGLAGRQWKIIGKASKKACLNSIPTATYSHYLKTCIT